jgi:chromosome segregation ATPase
MIDELGPEIRKNKHVIAKEMAEVERAKREIAKTQDRLDRQQAEVMRLKNDLASGTSVFQYAGHTYTEKQVRADLTARFARYRTNEATLENLKKVLQARETSLNAAREKLEQMIAGREQLKVDVENLEARMRLVEVAQTSSEHNLDDSRIARTRELISDLHTRLDVMEQLAHADGFIPDEIPLDEVGQGDIVDEVAEYFGDGVTHDANVVLER